MTAAEAAAFSILVLLTVAMLIFRPEAIWYAIVFVIDWTLHQITRPVDWLFRRYWP